MPLKPDILRSWPPNGWTFYQPETNWHAPTPMVYTFEQQVRNIMKMRTANPRFKLRSTYEACAEDLDAYTCARLKNHPKFCVSVEQVTGFATAQKKTSSPFPKSAGAEDAAAAGHIDPTALLEWLGDGARPESRHVAERRASVCVRCNQNEKPRGLNRLTRPVARGIRRYAGIKNQLSLHTPLDGELGVCKACNCHLELKVWVRREFIEPNTSADVRRRLEAAVIEGGGVCWVLVPDPDETRSAPAGDSAG